MPSKGNVNIVHDEQIWRDHIKTGEISIRIFACSAISDTVKHYTEGTT